MRRAILHRTPARLSASDTADLVQQESDFTAEGSPPPGRVANQVPRAAMRASLPNWRRARRVPAR